MIHHGLEYKNQANWQPICGHAQSPIHVLSHQSRKMEDEGNIILPNHIEVSHILREQTTILVHAQAKSMINGRKFNLLQFHFHSPAEHIIDDQRFDLELHLVHRSQSGRIAVLAILMKIGKPNPLFADILEKVNQKSRSHAGTIDLAPFLPQSRAYYHYLGSLTTPPLTENVEWYLFAQPIELSEDQLTRFRKMYHLTARDVQPLNHRPLLYHQP
ncbi:carbonic anhydrase family protein [Entomospira culicis]|uniref:carbonic anhydrase n=1 Tax=Entomospira culicis TaxID=2719989 RepID=A0A968GI19_9SPIO|nr:carbonic anhydrase family protein [Entomospira culicis]NIZ19208.1 carbonic anhydrase family protein [Entomospira culicis]NIZ69422.1 carbonic anhydrase family protein [Entomospira culicis]WDI36538.1 carbonic anhydrase family protein [Entomospira culicis]WDI38164.1 carbonic anhydrase family protein [Entomospira culicis]